MQAINQLRMENGALPCFTYSEAANDLELDFNILSEYLLVGDDDGGKVPSWTASLENVLQESKDTENMSYSDKDGR